MKKCVIEASMAQEDLALDGLASNNAKMDINRILCGDCIEIMKQIDDNSIDTIITSPPYWGLRDYKAEGQIGQEPLLNDYITKMLRVTAECKRILKPTGTMFWVHGNSYGGAASQPYGNRKGVYAEMLPHGLRRPKYIEKCLTMQNFRLAIRMIDDQGWILRNTIIWHKKNSMPSSVKDRLTNIYEPIFFFSKNKKYYFDLDAIRVPQKDASKKKIVTAQKQIGSKSIKNKEMHIFNRTYRSTKDICEKLDPQKGKNPGDVVALSTQPFPEAHFACVDSDTEALTKDGWKKYNDVTLDDEFATFDILTEKIKYHKPYEIFVYHCCDELITIDNRWLSQHVTFNHRVLLKNVHCATKRRADEIWHFEEAKKIRPFSGIRIPNGGTYDGQISIGCERAELLGWIVSEGHIKNGSCHIYQSESANLEKVKRIDDLLHATKQRYKKKRRERKYNDGARVDVEFILNKTENNNDWILNSMNGDKQPKWWLLHLKNDELKSLYDGLIDGDGHRRSDGRESFIQKNAYTRLWFRTLCVHLNKRTTEYKQTRTHRCGTVYVTMQNYSQVHPSDFKECVGKKKYSGIVWCPHLPNGTWISKRDGKISVTGNTYPEKLLEPFIKAACPQNGIVFDPFMGAGTTAVVAKRLGRNYLGIELNPDYIKIATKRISKIPTNLDKWNNVREK